MTKLVIRPQSVLLDQLDLVQLHDSERFLASFGPPSRRREIKMHPRGIRVAMVWDESGIVAYEDVPERQMSHLYLAFITTVTPEQPTQPSTAVIEINGGLLTSETTERSLPKFGQSPIVADFGGRYFCKSESYIVDFSFEHRSSSGGRKTGPRSLAFVSFSWF